VANVIRHYSLNNSSHKTNGDIQLTSNVTMSLVLRRLSTQCPSVFSQMC